MGAHSDDIEIGCGGTILKLLESTNVNLTWVVFCAHGEREVEAQISAKIIAKNAESLALHFKKFRDGYLPYSGHELKDFFEELKTNISTPDIIFTHYRKDLHQDHRLISDLTWNTFRNHFILEYEIAKYDADLGSPNLFTHLPEIIYEKKVQIIYDNFTSQRKKEWFTKDTFLSLMRIRGIESNSPSKYAEAFYSRKIVLN